MEDPADLAADRRLIFRACVRRELDWPTYLALRRAYWRTEDGRALLIRCAAETDDWAGGPDDQSEPSEEPS